MAFVAGSVVGGFGFGEAFPSIQAIYKSGSRGELLISTVFGVSNGQFAGAMIAVAVVAFILTTRIEKR